MVGTLALLVAMSGTAHAAHALPKNSVGSRQLNNNQVKSNDFKDGDVAAAALEGVDVSGTISVSLGANNCGTVSLAIGGALPGDAGFLTWTSAAPSLLVAPLEFDAADHATVKMCNTTGSTITVSGLGIRGLTFRS